MMNSSLLRALACAALLLTARPAAAVVSEAGESYVFPTFRELTQTTLILGGFDLNRKGVVDEYIRLMYCDLYKANYRDDFAWHGIRQQIAARIGTKQEYYRMLYQVAGQVALGPYDFTNQWFPLVEETAFQNVGLMRLYRESDGVPPYCDMKSPDNMRPQGDKVFPRNIGIALNQPFTLTHYKVPVKEAEQILSRMQRLRISGRRLYIRFRFRIQEVADVMSYNEETYSKADLRGEIIAADLFYDKEMTQWVGRVSMAR